MQFSVGTEDPLVDTGWHKIGPKGLAEDNHICYWLKSHSLSNVVFFLWDDSQITSLDLTDNSPVCTMLTTNIMI